MVVALRCVECGRPCEFDPCHECDGDGCSGCHGTGAHDIDPADVLCGYCDRRDREAATADWNG